MTRTTFLATIRQKYSWTQEEMANLLGVSRPTYISLEKGQGSLNVDQLNKLANKLGCDPQDFLSEEVLDEDKYKQSLLLAIKYGADEDGKITKTKLAKLLYLSDFSWYYKNLVPITGARYRRLDQGPVPNYYFSAIDELFDTGLIDIEISDKAQLITLTRVGQKVESTSLNKDENEQIRLVSEKWQGKKTQEIVAFTHDQFPYKICSPGEVIPYELITQQDPEYVY